MRAAISLQVRSHALPAALYGASKLPIRFAVGRIGKPIRLQPYSTTASSARVVDAPARVVDYAEVKALADGKDPNVVIVDAREPDEFSKGHIPNAVNIPYNSMPGALGLDAAEFEATLGFPKPDADKTLLFYCQAGVRSTNSEQLASTYGYTKRLNYKGSYQEWAEHEKPEAKAEATAS